MVKTSKITAMKKVTIILMAVLGMIYFQSCEKDKQGPFLAETLTAPELTSELTGTTKTLLEENELDTLAEFTWQPADYGFSAAAVYYFQIDFAGNNFEGFRTLGNTHRQKLTFTVGEINGALVSMGAEPETEIDLETRVIAVLHDDVDTLYSNVLSFTLIPFEKIIDYPRLYVPGDHNGWDAANENTVLWSANFNDRYEGYIYTYANPSYFKLLKVPAWEEDNTIGDPVAEGNSGTLQIGSWGGNNILIDTGPGLHKINADLNAETYSIMLTEWGIIGSAVPPYDWSVDVDMTYDDVENILSVTSDLQEGYMKFRANDDWALNYGDDEPDGVLESGGSDIYVPEAGNYTVILDLSQALYTYTLIKN